MEDVEARKMEALECAPWLSQFPTSLIYVLLLPFYSETKPMEYIIVIIGNNFVAVIVYLYMLRSKI